MPRPPDLAPDHGIDGELLVELANERALGRLAALHLATGELPLPRMTLAGRTLADEHAAAARGHGGHHAGH
jgi:hypothetical protein